MVSDVQSVRWGRPVNGSIHQNQGYQEFNCEEAIETVGTRILQRLPRKPESRMMAADVAKKTATLTMTLAGICPDEQIPRISYSLLASAQRGVQGAPPGQFWKSSSEAGVPPPSFSRSE